VHRGQPVEQERRVEADGQRIAVELDVAALLGLPLVVAAAGAQGDLPGVNSQRSGVPRSATSATRLAASVNRPDRQRGVLADSLA
jgi:hypothetical protein